MKLGPVTAAVLLMLVAPACARTEVAPQQSGLRLEEIARDLESPLFVTAPAKDARLFVVEQAGRIRVVRNGRLLPRPFLDISGKVSYGGERGLLGLAFHPHYASNHFFYVNYTDTHGDTRVVRYQASGDPDVADPASAKFVLEVDQPYANHNGGCIAFGPDGMLYIGMGDGGSGGDPHGNGQNLGTLLAKMLRLDVDHGDPYAIPADNPFAGRDGARPEIWACGLRNPWRFAFDPPAGLLYIADVGQDRWEEVDVVEARRGGSNFGWNVREGAHAFHDPNGEHAGMVEPALEYGHDQGCSVTGGFVYRGHALPSLVGTYFYADYCRGWIRSFRWSGGAATEQRTWRLERVGPILSFGQDAAGELYVCAGNGRVYRLAAEVPVRR